ncbi:hypothetical protein Clopa_1950 [Clostridium pasteurianum BC1]|uniref:Uncharacterized protein n=1 Tax=Clostridium pasteurianum BC1 TaxID=86416 RepID=R4KB36_CLOPA|nr:hypothetical protein Clopa_1950 [Clostridium pasteurianum BC1]
MKYKKYNVLERKSKPKSKLACSRNFSKSIRLELREWIGQVCFKNIN